MLFIDVVPRQVVGAPASLIPFLFMTSQPGSDGHTHAMSGSTAFGTTVSVVGTGMESAILKPWGGY